MHQFLNFALPTICEHASVFGRFQWELLLMGCTTVVGTPVLPTICEPAVVFGRFQSELLLIGCATYIDTPVLPTICQPAVFRALVYPNL